MGCELDFGDDFEKCELLIDEYEDILYKGKTEKLDENKKEKNKEEIEELKGKIRDMLELIYFLRIIIIKMNLLKK